MWTEVISCCTHCTKGLQVRSFSGPYFPLFWLNTEIFGLNLRIQSKCEKYGPENSVFVQVLCRDCYRILQFRFCYLYICLTTFLLQAHFLYCLKKIATEKIKKLVSVRSSTPHKIWSLGSGFGHIYWGNL